MNNRYLPTPSAPIFNIFGHIPQIVEGEKIEKLVLIVLRVERL